MSHALTYIGKRESVAYVDVTDVYICYYHVHISCI